VAFWNRKKSEAEVSLERLQAGTAEQAVPAEPTGPFELTIEDVFAITGRGTVVTGRVTSGVVRVGMPVTVNTEPTPIATTVTGVETFRKKAEQAGVGENVGLLLDGVGRDDVAPGNKVSG
jgi:translation elongation factor EF-Tu-like GTPase